MKIVYLDGLRGLAALIVVVSHFFQVFAPSVFEGRKEIEHFAFEGIAARTPFNLLFNGNFSVCLFFVLSGYVLSYRFFQTGDRLIIYSSAIRRYFRLAAPALVSVFLAYLIIVLDLGAYDKIRGMTLSSMPDPFMASDNLLVMLKEGLFHIFFTYGSQYNPVLWTMTYELFGSFLIFGFLVLCGRRVIRYAAYVLLIYVFNDSYYLGFVLGMLLADLKHSDRDWLSYFNAPWMTFIWITVGIYLGSYPYLDPEGTIYSILVWESDGFEFFAFYHVIGSFLILIALLNSRWLQALFHHKLFAYLGKISFSLYLLHFTIICTLGCHLFLLFSTFLSYGWNVIVTSLITVPVIFGAAHVFYRLVDVNVLSLLSRWSKKWLASRKRRALNAHVPHEKSVKAD
ncbi:acyltransferase [Paenibacillus sp. FSL K6-1330]|uniref:acyltransferase family protein n=1 Tax=Paenibacillus sp. FSL K6-1330 TaxID=2975292 RepID=UPI0030D9C2DC